MITVISGTNRTDNNTLKVSRCYAKELEKQGHEVEILNLQDLKDDFFTESMYGKPSESFSQVLNTKIIPADKFIIVVPEYNGSYPGILKLVLDTINPEMWAGSKAALLGIASGRAGNLRGVDHLTAVMHYLKTEVYSFKPVLSSIHLHLSEDGELTNPEYMGLIKAQIEGFLKF